MRTFLFMLLSMVSIAANAAVHTVKGKVIDQQGEPLIGVVVSVKGAQAGAVTDFDGLYSIEADDAAVLVFSSVGFTTQEVKVGKQTTLDITMREDVQNLEDLVVIGYGVQRKSDIISSVTSIKSTEMTKNTTLDMGQMLRGKAAGVAITTTSAAPGGSSSIQIRGVNSINGGTSPIIICDGVELGDINNVNPNDIESVEVLKDAAAQAIYGARAANGVILVTTKRGSQGKTSVTYNGYYGVSNVVRNFDTYTPEEYVQYKREAFRTTNGGNYGTDEEVFSASELASINAREYIDWQKELMRKGSIQSHNISVNTGNDRLSAYLSANFQDQNGVVRNTNYKKGNIRVNLDYKINSALSAGVNTFISVDHSSGPGTSTLLRDAVTCSPLGKVRDAEGNLNMHPTALQENWNPLADIYGVDRTGNNRNDLVNIFFDWKIFKGLKYRLNLSRRSWQYKGETYNSVNSRAGYATGKGSATVSHQDNMEWLVDNILSYNRSFGLHNVDATLIQSWSEKHSYVNNMSGSLIPNDLLGVYGMSSAEIITPTMSGTKRRLVSTAFRAQYNFDSRYYLSASVRRDGSSVFGANNKWGIFPAVAAGWNVYMEPWLRDVKQLSNLKLRFSYGSVGNEAIAPYGSVASADQWDYYTTSQQTGYAPGAQISNPSLRWETTTTMNLALDFGFFNNRLFGTIEYYRAHTTDLLVNRSIGSSSGYSTMRDNIGRVENNGLEVQLGAVLVSTRDFDLRTNITYSHNRNSIAKLFGDKDGDGIEDDYPQNNWFIGQPISIYRNYKVIGIWQEADAIPDENGETNISKSAQPTAEPGMVKLWDKNEDGAIGDEDRIITSRYPKWQGSFNLQGAYKGFDFSLDLYTVQGITKLNPFLYDYSYGGNMRATFNGVKVDYWTPENPDALFPRPTTNGQNDMTWLALEDASYIRLQNLQFGYTLPQKFISHAHINKLRFYVTAQNLLTLTDFHSYSPEQTADNYPDCRSFSLGVQLGF